MAPYALNRESFDGIARVDWVDVAKGLCIIFVVMMHSTLGVEKHAGEIGLVSEGTTGWMNWIVTFAEPFRMPDFFLISGLFLGLVISKPWLRYIDRKVVHFAYFYVLWLAIQFAFRSIGWVSNGTGMDEILGSFLWYLVNPYGTLWFIYILPVMFIVTRLLRNVHWLVVLAGAALLEIAPVHTGFTVVDEFAARYVYFFLGYAVASNVFFLARRAEIKPSWAIRFLAVWFMANAALVFMPIPDALSAFVGEGVRYSQLPVLSLLLGLGGAIAIICVSVAINHSRAANVFRYLGQNSIVIYLTFFLPMVITREILFRFAPSLDLGTMSLIVLCVSVLSSIIAYEFTRRTGWFQFLYVRPDWAKLETARKSHKAGLQPAE